MNRTTIMNAIEAARVQLDALETELRTSSVDSGAAVSVAVTDVQRGRDALNRIEAQFQHGSATLP